MGKKTALIIDDSRATRMMLQRMISQLGYEVHEAANGKEALTYLQEKSDDVALALIDWNMPEMNGFEFVQSVRNEKKFDEIRLIMVTAETELERVKQALNAGANEYVMKPFTKETIQEKLQLAGVVHI